MQDAVMRWPPQVGDWVGIKGSRLVGIVRTITQADGRNQRVVVSVRAPDTNDPEDYLKLVTVAEQARTIYLLRELEPFCPVDPGQPA
jgi:hypothetical protein